MNIKIWDHYNKQVLEPIAIYFGKDNTIWKIDACKLNEDPLTDGWYEFRDEQLKYIAISGEMNYNAHLILENIIRRSNDNI